MDIDPDIVETTEHKTTNFVDDSSSVINNDNDDKLQIYINKYFELLGEYYNAMKLTLNPTKTNILSFGSGNNKPSDLKLETEEETV